MNAIRHWFITIKVPTSYNEKIEVVSFVIESDTNIIQVKFGVNVNK